MIQDELTGDPGLDRVKIYPRGKKRIYCADFSHNDKHRRVSLKTRNAKEARRLGRRLECQLDEGTYDAPQVPTEIEEVVRRFVSSLATEGRRPKTVTKYRGFLTTFTQFCADQNIHQIKQVTILLVDRFRSLRKLSHHPKSMFNEGVMLKSFFRWAKLRKFVLFSPMEEMTFKRPAPQPRSGPTLEQIDQVLATAREQRRTLLAVLAFTGMRAGELQRLQVIDVDLAGNWIQVVSREGIETKTGLSRKIPIHSRLRPYLTAVTIDRRRWFFESAASKKYPDGGHWISGKHLNEDFLEILRRLGIPAGRDAGFTIHSLRHSFETICVNAGIPQRVIDTWLGHRSDTSMASVYYLLSDDESQKFMSRVPFGTGTPAADAGDTEVGS